MKNIFIFNIIFILVLFFGACNNKIDESTIRLYTNAHELYVNGQFSDTAELLNSVKKFSPALTLRAKAEFFNGDLDKSEKSFRLAIKSRPGSVEPKLYLARIMLEKGEDVKAKKLTEELLADNYHDPRILRFAASLAMEQGDITGASVFLDQAAELAAEGAMVLLDRARLRWINGNGTDALEDLSRAKAILPWDTPLARSINNLENRILEVLQ